MGGCTHHHRHCSQYLCFPTFSPQALFRWRLRHDPTELRSELGFTEYGWCTEKPFQKNALPFLWSLDKWTHPARRPKRKGKKEKGKFKNLKKNKKSKKGKGDEDDTNKISQALDDVVVWCRLDAWCIKRPGKVAHGNVCFLQNWLCHRK